MCVVSCSKNNSSKTGAHLTAILNFCCYSPTNATINKPKLYSLFLLLRFAPQECRAYKHMARNGMLKDRAILPQSVARQVFGSGLSLQKSRRRKVPAYDSTCRTSTISILATSSGRHIGGNFLHSLAVVNQLRVMAVYRPTADPRNQANI